MLLTEVLALLERFDEVRLWMNEDGPGREGAEKFTRKLVVERCLVVRPSGRRVWNDRVEDRGGGYLLLYPSLVTSSLGNHF